MTPEPAPIRRLSPEVVARIAAGEVIERPASVVKELLENSLDAGAGRITVEVEGSPDRLIRVADNGHGMTADGLRLALERHATSKIRAAEDLLRVTSLGFRGEGLPSVAAVSRIAVLTSTGEGAGTRLVAEGGTIVEVDAAGRGRGTTVEVRDLFFNTPARRKFQRAASTELQMVARTLQSYALARPDLHLVYAVDGREILNLPPAASLGERMSAIYGPERTGRMIPVDHGDSLLRLAGFLGAPEDSRARSDQQTFFINGRWVSNPLLRQAVRQAYGNLIPFDRHPFAVLAVEIDPTRVDVNVHPTKREVRFSNDRDLFPALVTGLKRVVEGHVPGFVPARGARPADWPEAPSAAEEPPTGDSALEVAVRDVADLFGGPGDGEAPAGARDAGRDLPRIVAFSPGASLDAGEGGETAEPARADLWQLHRTYILAATRGGLLIIDQHAAHERILFEESILRLRGARAASQELLFPRVVDLTAEEFHRLLDIQPVLERLGFHLELFGGTTVVVHGIPAGLTRWHDGALLHEMIALYGDLPGGPPVEERVARSYACRAAVKAGEPLDPPEMNELVDRLFATTLPQGDPHGRPTYLRIAIEDLHRRFGRSG